MGELGCPERDKATRDRTICLVAGDIVLPIEAVIEQQGFDRALTGQGEVRCVEWRERDYEWFTTT